MLDNNNALTYDVLGVMLNCIHHFIERLYLTPAKGPVVPVMFLLVDMVLQKIERFLMTLSLTST